MNIPYNITHLVDIEGDPLPFYIEKTDRLSVFDYIDQISFAKFITCHFL
jgi:hypothetical protein